MYISKVGKKYISFIAKPIWVKMCWDYNLFVCKLIKFLILTAQATFGILQSIPWTGLFYHIIQQGMRRESRIWKVNILQYY